MKTFPKKYNAQELRNRSKKYREINKNDENGTIFSLGNISISEKFSYQNFFDHYIKDFGNYIKAKNNDSYQQLFIASSNQIKSICSGYEFFSKRNQRFKQIGIEKFGRHMISVSQKNIKANNKILENYLSSPYKLYVPDTDLYLYIINKFHSLWESGKLTYEDRIGYWSFNLQTSIANQHIKWKEEKRPFYVLKYFIGAKGETLPVCLDDIDLCCGDVALLVHPKDKRYNKYIGNKAIIPLCNRQIPIIGDENVNIALNNGIQRICPCSNQESIEIAKKYGLPTDIYVFNQEGLYTEYIHEPAFIGQQREKYYNNIEGFISDIGNLDKKEEIIVKTPYLNYTNERLIPYKINQIILNLEDEKKTIINKILNHDLEFSFLDGDIGKILNQIDLLKKDSTKTSEIHSDFEKDTEQKEEYDNSDKIFELKQKIIDEIGQYMPDFVVCNSQLEYGWKVPLKNDLDGNLSFFDIEKECENWDEKPMQFCFNFVILCLIRIGVFGNKGNGNKQDKTKLCEYDKFIRILSENEKKIEYFVRHLSEITGEKSEYKNFSQIIQNLTDEQSPSINECLNLMKESKILQQDGNRIRFNLTGISNDIMDHDFIQLCIPCYLYDKNIKVSDEAFFNKEDKEKTLRELLIQELFLGKTIPNKLNEISYNAENEFLGDKQLTKFQKEQSQRDLFKQFGENPIRLNFLINQTYDQKEILLNNLFFKQIRNATRLCIQKDFLPKNIEDILSKQPEIFEDSDILILYNLNDLYNSRKEIETYEDYVKFFINFKRIIQNLFFSRYLEIQKINPSNNIQFICSYFFSLLSNIMYPLTPEFIDALQYVSDRKFLIPVNSIKLNKSVDFNLHLIYDTFLQIKNLKIESNIKQHESCNLFIKSNPTICELFGKYEQFFKNYFHVNEIFYFRLHEQSPLGYETVSNELLTIGIQPLYIEKSKEKDTIETLERDIKNLDDKLILLRQSLQVLPEGEQRKSVEKDYAKTKEELENLTIKYSILSSK